MNLPDHISFLQVVDGVSVPGDADTVLTESELARRTGFGSEARRRSFTLGRFAARTLLAEPMGRSAREVPLEVREDGSLDVPGGDFNVSISHSGIYAAAAISTHEIGLDLELVRPRSESLFRFVLHPDEQGLRESVPLPQDQQLVLFWALKEAVLKGKRTGLRRSPKSLRLEIDLESGEAVIQGIRTWSARFAIRDDHVVAVAWPEGSAGRPGPEGSGQKS